MRKYLEIHWVKFCSFVSPETVCLVLLNLFLATRDKEKMRCGFGIFDIFCVISLQMHSPSKAAITESRTPLKTLTPKVCPFRIKGLLAACLLLVVYSIQDSPSHDSFGELFALVGKARFWYHK